MLNIYFWSLMAVVIMNCGNKCKKHISKETEDHMTIYKYIHTDSV